MSGGKLGSAKGFRFSWLPLLVILLPECSCCCTVTVTNGFTEALTSGSLEDGEAAGEGGFEEEGERGVALGDDDDDVDTGRGRGSGSGSGRGSGAVRLSPGATPAPLVAAETSPALVAVTGWNGVMSSRLTGSEEESAVAVGLLP